MIAQVVKGSAADKAGLKVGDVIVALDGKPVTNSADLRNKIGMMRVGQQINLKIIRNGKERKVKAAIGEPQAQKMDAGDIDKRLSGAKLGAIDADHPLFGQVEGIEVLDVEHDSPAWDAGLRKDDVIVSVNRHPVKDLSDMRRAAKKSGGLLLNVRRGNGALFLLLK